MRHPSGKSTRDTKDRGGPGRERTYQGWRYKNPEGLSTKVVEGTTMTWCTNDCHPKPMWCERRNCLSKAEFAAKMQSQREGGSTRDSNRDTKKQNEVKVNEEFKMALAALTSPEDFALLVLIPNKLFSNKRAPQ